MTLSMSGSQSLRRENHQHLRGLQLTLLDSSALDLLLTVLGWGKRECISLDALGLGIINLQEQFKELATQLDKFKCFFFFINNHFTLQG